MSKYSVKLILRSKVTNKHDHSPIYVRITVDRKTSYISTGHYISPKMWDEKNQVVKDSHPIAYIINPDITNRKTNLLRSIVNAQIKGSSITSASLKSQSVNKHDAHNIFDFADQYIKEIKNKRKTSTINNMGKHMRRLAEFQGNRRLSFDEITPEYLGRLENHLRTGEKKIGANYSAGIFMTLRTMFNKAIEKKLITDYPFTEYENPVYTPPIKDYLNLSELQAIEKFVDQTEDPALKQTAIYFLLGCYSGLRVSDWQAFNIKKNIVNGKLKLYAKKNGELVLMPISKPLARTLKRIESIPLKTAVRQINKLLKVLAIETNITKRISTHTGRHTFAVTICAEQGISSEVCSTLMGITIVTCIRNYYKISSIKIDNEVKAAWSGLE